MFVIECDVKKGKDSTIYSYVMKKEFEKAIENWEIQ